MKMSWGETLKTSVVGFLVVLVVLAVIACLILLVSKVFVLFQKVSKKEEGPALKSASAPPPEAPKGTALPDNLSEGDVKLINVDEPTAAVIMAIVSDETGIPLNRLLFKSIELKED